MGYTKSINNGAEKMPATTETTTENLTCERCGGPCAESDRETFTYQCRHSQGTETETETLCEGCREDIAEEIEEAKLP
jgi:hypothetical protein